MCGLVGMMGRSLLADDSKAMNILLHLDVLRGLHSTGVGIVKKDEVQVLKAVGKPDNLYEKYKGKGFNDDGTIPIADVRAIIGHNRWATKGEVNEHFAHPFDMGNIVGAHNGTVNINSLKNLTEENEQNDSQMIFRFINDSNEDLEELWSEANGAMALVWWNKEKNTLNFLRNEERDFNFTLNNFNSNIYWASEKWMLHVALNRNRITYKEVHATDPNVHYCISMQKKEGYFLDVIDIQTKEIKKKPRVFQSAEIHDKVVKVESNRVDVDKEFTVYYYEAVPRRNGAQVRGYFSGFTEGGIEIKIVVRDRDEAFTKYLSDKLDDGFYPSFAANVFTDVHGKKSKYLMTYPEYCVLIDTGDYDLSPPKKDDEGIVIENELGGTEELAMCYNGEYLNKKMWEERTKCKCWSCLEGIEWEDRETVSWAGAEMAICNDCYEFFNREEKE